MEFFILSFFLIRNVVLLFYLIKFESKARFKVILDDQAALRISNRLENMDPLQKRERRRISFNEALVLTHLFLCIFFLQAGMILDNGVKTTEANAKDKRPYLSLIGARYISNMHTHTQCFYLKTVLGNFEKAMVHPEVAFPY